MNKQELYNEIVKKVNNCDLCYKITATPRKGDQPIRLECEKTEHVNLWSYWQGNLSPEILLIGQDWGKKPEPHKLKTFTNKEEYRKHIKSGESKTDSNLVSLFEKVFSIDILTEQRLFFTNSVFCYKSGNLNENVSTSWFNNCNEHFMGSLISLLKPKCIITLGNKALQGLFKSGDITYSDGSPAKIKNKSLTKILDNPNQLWWNSADGSLKIRLFPVFHPGGYSNRNRPLNKQLADWSRIKQFVEL